MCHQDLLLLLLVVGVAGALVVVVAGGVGDPPRGLAASGSTLVEPSPRARSVVAGSSRVLVSIAPIIVAGVATATAISS